ncbi:MAG: hypothetical protein APF81_25240 [Desulfosporosinus sp. BRH_c37]|nr:MAG: hypothetical protein APF81_25240 [Desulfosporosinus sp. BRH_c37]
MDEKMIQMLTQLIEGQNETNQQLSELTNRVGGFESKVDRTTILLEETQRNVKVIGEGLVAFREQIDRLFEEFHAYLNEKTDLLETVLKANSSEVNKLKDESKHIQGIIGEHEVSIRILKTQNP